MDKRGAWPPSSTTARATNTPVSPFWLYGMLGALFVSNAGTALQLVTQAWFVWELSHRPATVGLLGLVQATPLLGVPLLGGMLADRFPRRRLLLFTQSTLALIAALMGSLALTHFLAILPTLILAGMLASVSALDNPIRQVYLPGVVEERQRGRTVGLNALTYNAGAIAGPAAAGVLLPVIGVGWCFLLNACSYLTVIAWLLAGPAAPPRPAQHSNGVSRSVTGAVWSNAPIYTLLLLVGVVSLLGRSYPTVLPIVVSKAWGSDVRTYGVLAALPGIGAVLAAVLVVWILGLREQKHPLWIGGTLPGIALIWLGFARNLAMAGIALFFMGCAATGTMTLLNARLQELTPNEVRGRVMSFYTWLAAGMPALGGWLLGTLMAFFPPQPVLAIVGIMLVGATLLLSLGSRHSLRTSFQEEDEPS